MQTITIEEGVLIQVVIADPRQMLCEGIQRMLRDRTDIKVIAAVSTKAALVRVLEQGRANIALLNPRLGAERGPALIRQLRAAAPQVALLALASDAQCDDPVSLMRAGAKGYLSRENTPEDLVRALHKVGCGKLFVDRELGEQIAADLCVRVRRDSYQELSPREAEVFRLLTQGRTVSQIAALLRLSVKTVSTHKSRIMTRLGLATLSELIQYAISHDLLDRTDEASPAHAPSVLREEDQEAA
jgi:DNA-binding NarL/FixJ family response regulator